MSQICAGWNPLLSWLRQLKVRIDVVRGGATAAGDWHFRMALGADRRRVVRDVVRDGLAVTLAGLAGGVVAALATVRVVETLLFGVTPQDPLTLAAVAASLIAIAIAACAVPASRAARVDPMIALRGD